MSLHDSLPSADEDFEPSGDSLGIQELIREQLVRIGEDPDREGLLKTPLRVDKAMAYLTRGYRMNIEEIVNKAIFEEKYDEMVIVKQIEFYSMCEHHMLPFFGVAHVGYIPRGKVIGLSKIPRIIEMYSRRLQLQERMTQQIAECIWEILNPLGVGVVTEAQHLCMMMRGVQKEQSYAMSSSMLGAFRTDRPTRNEFLTLISHSGIK